MTTATRPATILTDGGFRAALVSVDVWTAADRYTLTEDDPMAAAAIVIDSTTYHARHSARMVASNLSPHRIITALTGMIR